MRRDSAGAVTALELLQGVLQWVVVVAGVAVGLVTAYYLYATFGASAQLFRGEAAAGGEMSAAEFQRHVQNTRLLTQVLVVAGSVLLLAVMARFYMFAETGLALIVLGAAFLFGMPVLITTYGGGGDLPPALAKVGNPKEILVARYQLTGAILGGAGLVYLLAHGVALVLGSSRRRPQPNAEAARTAAHVKKLNDQFLGPCWKLPFCRDTEKELCPVRHNKKPCWRGGNGCYCDQNIILAISGGNQYAASRGSSGYLARTAVARPKTLREKREQCLQCPVYLHHQSQKHRLVAPLTLAAAAVFFGMNWGAVLNGYRGLMLGIGKALSGFSFREGQTTAWSQDIASNPHMMWLVLIMCGVLLLAYSMQAVEWLLYRLGI